MTFTVIDTKTGRYPDVSEIALTEDWAKHLIYCDIDGFYLGEDGNLVLVDDCGNAAFPPPDRFEIVWEVNEDEPDESNATLYVKYDSDGCPIAYAYGEPWVAQALYMDDIRHKTPKEAKEAWRRSKK